MSGFDISFSILLIKFEIYELEYFFLIILTEFNALFFKFCFQQTLAYKALIFGLKISYLCLYILANL